MRLFHRKLDIGELNEGLNEGLNGTLYGTLNDILNCINKNSGIQANKISEILNRPLDTVKNR